jgi:hypothetical protein
MKRILVIGLLLVSIFLIGAVKSEAVCSLSGKIVYAVTNGGTYGVYVAPITPLPSYYFYFTTTDPEIISTLNAAQASNNRIVVVGNVASCPTSGNVRTGGVITTVYMYTF